MIARRPVHLSRHPGMSLAGIPAVNCNHALIRRDSGLRRAGMTILNDSIGDFFIADHFARSAGSDKNAGTSGAQFLKIGAGARPTAMGDSFVGVADDANAVYYNPAGLGISWTKLEFTAMHTQYFQGLTYDFGAYIHPLQSGAIGLSAAKLETDALTRRGLDESNTGSFTDQDAAYAFSYGLSSGGTAFSAGINGAMDPRKYRHRLPRKPGAPISVC